MADTTTTKVETTTSSPAAEVTKTATEVLVDYKAELEKEKALRIGKEKQLEKAEHTIISLKKKKEVVEADGSDVVEDTVDVDEIMKQAKEAGRVEAEKVRVDMAENTIETVLGGISNSEERELTKFHYENTIRKTGFNPNDVARDIANARALANRPKVEAQERELKRALESKETKSSGYATGEASIKMADKLSDAEEAWIAEAAKRTGKPATEVRALLLKNSIGSR